MQLYEIIKGKRDTIEEVMDEHIITQVEKQVSTKISIKSEV
jgi:hypothetical protein